MTKKPGCELWSSMHGKICFVFTLFDKCSEVLDHIYNNIPASNDMWGPDEGFMGGKCGPHYGLAPGIHIGASRGSPDVLKVGPVRVLHGS